MDENYKVNDVVRAIKRHKHSRGFIIEVGYLGLITELSSDGRSTTKIKWLNINKEGEFFVIANDNHNDYIKKI